MGTNQDPTRIQLLNIVKDFNDFTVQPKED